MTDKNFLTYGHARRKQLKDDLWWDIYFDPIYEELDVDFAYLEKQYQNGHLTPAKTDNIKYRDIIHSLARVWRKTGIDIPQFNATELDQIDYIEDQIEEEFKVKLDLTEQVRYKLEIRRPLHRLYQQMLRRIDPKLVLLVVSYGRETFIESCSEMDIPVAELQHGIIHPKHLGYTYPGTRDKITFPDYLLVWGDYWKTQATFPIPDDRVLTVGYPYLERSINQYESTSSQEQIVFISQGTIGEELSKFAVEVDRHSEIDHDIVYKLHPGEYDRWQDEYPWLVNANFEVIDGSEPPLYELFSESSVQVGVYSTAIYEGLAFDLETYVYDCAGPNVLEPLIEEGSAELIASVDELVAALGTEKNSFKSDYYFAPNATENVCDILERLADEGTPYQEDCY